MEQTKAIELEHRDMADVVLSDPARRVASIIELLRGDADRIVANWVLRVANMPAFRAWPDLGLDQLKDAVPDLIDATMTAMSTTEPERDLEPRARAVEIAAELGRGRGRDGFPIGAVLAEFQTLREELRSALSRVVGDDPARYDVARNLEEQLIQTVDAAVIEAAEAWVDEAMNRARSG
ncbi:MAG TPA: RsbRD N-terminal domain-containing protein [Thermomicrobiales bacterium]|nr:RsbRD N-terminal domain-containing protein [Thermomicrobiales bacterium]